jgi:DNA replication protein DnaC
MDTQTKQNRTLQVRTAGTISNARTSSLIDSRQNPGSEERLCPHCQQPIPPLLFDEAGQPVDSEAQAAWSIPPEYCPCPAGQQQKELDESRRRQREWFEEAKQLILPLEVGKYGEFKFSTWDPTRPNQNARQVLNAVRTYVDNVINSRTKKWLYLHGSYGLGKTHLAVAALRQIAAERLWEQQLVVWPDHCSQVKESWHANKARATLTEGQLWGLLRRAQILLIDDIDKNNSTQWAMQKLYEVIDYRVIRDKPTIITANHSVAQLRGMWARSQEAHIRDTGMAILSRIAGQLSAIVEFTGQDQRWS